MSIRSRILGGTEFASGTSEARCYRTRTFKRWEGRTAVSCTSNGSASAGCHPNHISVSSCCFALQRGSHRHAQGGGTSNNSAPDPGRHD